MSSVPNDPNVVTAGRTECPAPEATQQPHVGKSKEEIYLELARLSHQSFTNRQSYEWKTAFGLWTAIGATTYFATEHAGVISGPGMVILVLAYILVWGAWSFVWQAHIQSANGRDKAWKHYYMHRAENRPEDRSERDPWRSEPTIPWRERMQALTLPAAWVTSIATLVFLALSFVIILANSNRVSRAIDKDVISISGDNATKVVDKLTK